MAKVATKKATKKRVKKNVGHGPVSYTHLTLPTIA